MTSALPARARRVRKRDSEREQDEDEHRVRGGVAVLRVAREAQRYASLTRMSVRSVGLAARDQEHDVEHVEGPHRAERDGRHAAWARSAAA